MKNNTHDENSLPLSHFYKVHVSRYWWASDFTKGKQVLDCSCNKGYGSYILSHNARKVVGLDINKEDLDIAEKEYSQKNNLKFIHLDVFKISTRGEKYDIITAFELIEHLPPETTDALLSELGNSLNEGGKLLISTPNNDVALKSGMVIPPYHINNFKPTELKRVLKKHFKKVKMIGQYRPKSVFYNVIFFFDCFNLRNILLSSVLKFLNLINLKNSSKNPELKNKNHGHLKLRQRTPIESGTGDFNIKPIFIEEFNFSPFHWRQGYITIAICEKPIPKQKRSPGTFN